MRNKTILIFLCTGFLLAGCGNLASGTPAYDEDATKTSYVTGAMESPMERASRERHAAPALDPSFISQYVDTDQMNASMQNIDAGIAVTNANAALTAGEAAMWQKIISSKQINQVTSEDIAERQRQLQAALESLSAEKKMTLEEFASQPEYNMTFDEVKAFIKKQAEKYKPGETPISTNSSQSTKSNSANTNIQMQAAGSTAKEDDSTNSTSGFSPEMQTAADPEAEDKSKTDSDTQVEPKTSQEAEIDLEEYDDDEEYIPSIDEEIAAEENAD